MSPVFRATLCWVITTLVAKTLKRMLTLQRQSGDVTPLMLAVRKNDLKLVRTLVDLGANVRIPTNDGWFHSRVCGCQ